MDASSYQLFRLWSGICSIGINLGMIWAAFFASHLLPGVGGVGGGWVLPLSAFSLALILVLAFLPFEILIGYAGEAAFSRSQQSFSEWLKDWSQAQWFIVAGLVGGICLFGWMGGLGWIWQLSGIVLVCLLAAAFMFTLPFWIRFLGGIKEQGDPDLEANINQHLAKHDSSSIKLVVINDGDEEGVNGAILPFHRNIFTINHAARQELEAEDLAALALREQWFHRKGQSSLCLVIVLAWLAVGLLLAMTVPGTLLGAGTPIQLGLGGAAVMSTWCFLALLTWPPLNNHIMLKADEFLAQKIGVEETVALLNKIQTLNESDFDLSAAKEHVFHPIPSLRKRLEHLKVF